MGLAISIQGGIRASWKEIGGQAEQEIEKELVVGLVLWWTTKVGKQDTEVAGVKKLGVGHGTGR